MKKHFKNIKKHQIILCVFFLIFGVFVYWLNNEHLSPYQMTVAPNKSYEKAEVLKVIDSSLEADNEANSGYRGTQELKLKITSGIRKGEVVEATNHLTRTHNIFADEGATLIVCIDESDVSYHVSIYNYSRASTVYIMIFLFLALMVIVGDWKGLKSAIGLVFTLLCILFFTLPMIFNGYSPILISIITVVLLSSVTLILIDGVTKKMFIALCSTACGVILAGVIFSLFSRALKVSGFNMDDAEAMIIISQNTGLQLKQVLFASVLIASVGAVLDVAMSIASTLNEIHERNPELPNKELFKSGINVGKDMIGTMSNTLILAYVGSSFTTMLVFFAYSVNFNQIINMDYFILEIAQALAGSMGIVLTVPFASFLGARVFTAQKKNKQVSKKSCF